MDLAALFNASPNPYIILDRNFDIVGMNDAYLRVTMRTREQLVGRNMFEAFPGDPEGASGRILRASLARVLTQKTVDHLSLIPYAIARPDGVLEERYWSATHTPMFDGRGEVAFILQHTVDVTELHLLRSSSAASAMHITSSVFRRAEAVQIANQALDAERGQIRALFEQAPSFMALLRGPDHVFELANAAYLRLVGRPVVGLPVRLALPEVDTQGFLNLLDQVYGSGEPFVGQAIRTMLRQDADGPLVEHYLDFIYQPLMDEDGQVVGIFVQGHDITEQKRAEQALQELNDTLEQQVAERTRELRANQEALRQSHKLEAVGQLTGGVAHDFNNMLQGISGSLEMVQRRIAQGRVAEIDRYMTAARDAIDRAAKLTHRLLAFARRQDLQPRPIDPLALIRGMKEFIRRAVGPEVRVDLELGEGPWTVLCDANQLESALLNLCINARDAMPEGGRILITATEVRLTEKDLVEEDGLEPGQFVEIAVADDGVGMTPEVLERAFEPFFTTKPLGQGTGLGLSQIYGFVRQSGGWLRATSTPGEGTTIRIYLPRRNDLVATESEPLPSGPVPDRQEGAIVLVEDDDAIREATAERLREQGYRVTPAADGTAALALLQRAGRVDLLVTDVGLPSIPNGRQLAEIARQQRPDLPVLFITGYAAAMLENSLDQRTQMISKPFAFDLFSRKVRDLIQKDT
ncbi:PAS domain-containing protein [Geminicoccus roseus]|uniref:PAS domain-containing protein n=1 Tax=Geminicoccus roseus TaxID=404900 RepID=UPI0004197D14|nr:PAS domain-containing protein [Geminicoccus roseus]